MKYIEMFNSLICNSKGCISEIILEKIKERIRKAFNLSIKKLMEYPIRHGKNCYVVEHSI